MRSASLIATALIGAILASCSSISIDESTRRRSLYRDRVDTQNVSYCYTDKKTKTTTCSTIPVPVITVLAEVAVAKASTSDVCYLVLNGRIDDELSVAFEKSLAELLTMNCSRKIAVLSSPGGRVRNAVEIGLKIRGNGFDTLFDGVKGRGNRCASSCTLIFIAGHARIVTENPISLLSGQMGFHRWSRGIGNEEACLNPDIIRRGLKPYAEKMLPVEAASHFIDMTVNTECNKVENLSPDELVKLGIANRKSLD